MESRKNNFNIKQEIFKYLSFWRWIVLSIIISLIVCFFYLRYANDVYQTTSKIKILDNSNTEFKLPTTDKVSIFGSDESSKGNEIVIMKSARIIEMVIDRLNLTTEIYSKGRIKSIELWKNAPIKVVWAKEKDSLVNEKTSFQILLTKKGYQIVGNRKEYKFGETNFNTGVPCTILLKNKSLLNKLRGNIYQIVLKPRKSIVQSISNSIVIDYVIKQSDILSLTLNGFNQEKINDIVDTLVEVFNQDGIQDRQLVSKKTIEFVDNRFKFIFNELDSIEFSKANFKKQNELSFVEADAGVLMQNNYESKSKLETASTQIVLAKLMMSALNATKGLELLPSNIGIENSEVNGLVANYNEQILKRNKLLISGGESNPMVKEAATLALQIKSNIKASIIGYQKILEFNRDEFIRINNVNGTRYSKLPYDEKGIRSIERQQSIKESLYVLLLQKREEAAINLAITNPSIKVVDYAIFSESPIAPDRNIVFIIALLIGIFFPILILYVSFYLFENKINSKEDLELLIPDVPVIAEIPYIETETKTIQSFDRSILSESFRILRNNINYINPKTDQGSVLFVTSTIKGEGKTFISLNLAITLSTLGKKIILIGADLRNPQLHRILDIERPTVKGITNYLYDTDVKIDDIKVVNQIDSKLKFDIIFSGNIPPNPAELLSNGQFEVLLNELKNDYDYIVVDTAPTLLVADTTLITHLADSVLYVIRANFTEKKLLKFISNLKTLNTIKNMGIILNNVGQNKGYGYSYSYNYGYGYGYDKDSIKNTSIRYKLKKWFTNRFKK